MLNLPFALFHPEWTLVELPLLRSFAINCVLFLVPGIPFAGAIFGRRKPRLGSLAWTVALSFGIFVGVVTLFYLAGWPLSSDRAWNATWIVTNIGLLVCVLSGRPTTWALSFDKRMWTVGGTLFLMAYLLYFFGASRVVPPQSDHDLEVQGSSTVDASSMAVFFLVKSIYFRRFSDEPLTEKVSTASVIKQRSDYAGMAETRDASSSK